MVGDTHAPWVHDAAFSALEAYAADLVPDLVLHIGDFFDFHSISRHQKDNFRTLQAEIDESRPYVARFAALPVMRTAPARGAKPLARPWQRGARLLCPCLDADSHALSSHHRRHQLRIR